ncbi:hypothetical protein PFISCL1PPCAC_11515, partial [Pristionchus fissidentatus]
RMSAVAVLLLLFVQSSYTLVDFSHSTLYDAYDFVGKDEVLIAKCNFGCRIYASTAGTYGPSDDGFDPFNKNLLIVDNVAQKNYSIAEVAPVKNTQTKQKVPLEFKNPSSISVVNMNGKDNKPNNIVVYVLDLATASGIKDYEIYDVNDVMYPRGVIITTNSIIVTVMGTEPFSIVAQPDVQPNSATTGMVGFDNVLDTNPDGCMYNYQTPASTTFPGFNVFFPGPIGSVAFAKKGQMKLTIDWAIDGAPDLKSSGCVASAGYSGCSRPGIGPLQTFRMPQNDVPNFFVLLSNTDNYAVSMEVLPNLADGHKITIDALNPSKTYFVKNTTPQNFYFPSTNNIYIDSTRGLSGTEGYLVRYTTTLIPKPATTTAKAIKASSTMESSTTQRVTAPTTSDVSGVMEWISWTSAYILVLFPLLNPIIFVICTKEYRNWILNYIFRNSRVSAVAKIEFSIGPSRSK